MHLLMNIIIFPSMSVRSGKMQQVVEAWTIRTIQNDKCWNQFFIGVLSYERRESKKDVETNARCLF